LVGEGAVGADQFALEDGQVGLDGVQAVVTNDAHGDVGRAVLR
jgi:hypothetical protein